MERKPILLIFLFCFVLTAFAQSPSTPAPPTLAPTTVQVSTATPAPCSGHGTCQCAFGYTGPDCSDEVDWCKQPTSEVESKPLVEAVCGDRGVCVSSPAGARCECHEGYSGIFCDIMDPSKFFLSNRCLAYNISYGEHQLHWSPDDQIGCGSKEECVPDDLQCLLTPCDLPIGWCLPNDKARPLDFKTRQFEGKQWFYKDNAKDANGPCSDHGTCTCDHGYKGDDCQDEVDWCNTIAPGFNESGLIKEACGFNGTCVTQPAGAFCICDEGFSGQFCNIVNSSEIFISRRCYAYPPKGTPQPGVPVNCTAPYACVPENLQCFVPFTCKDPIGWCLPMVPVKNSDAFRKLLVHYFIPTN